MIFEVISYLIDVSKGECEPAPSLLDLGLLVAFFPHLIAGPILKPRHFLPQLQGPITVTRNGLDRGAQIFVLGLLKKLLVADRLAPFCDQVFAEPSMWTSGTVWLAVIAYAFQIYCDFSGYSDMAIGSACMLGFDLPYNFRSPYVALNIAEFWRRWHISLSTWFREYLYFSLGGNRRGVARQYANLMLVMLLCGLWHGANWTFVLWGGLHGLGLIAHRAWGRCVRVPASGPQVLLNSVNWVLTMLFVAFTWVVFRCQHVDSIGIVMRKMLLLGPTGGVAWYATALLVIAPVFAVAHYVGSRRPDYPRLDLGSWRGQVCAVFVLLGILYFAPDNTSPFIYFQF
jgi:alginate O-acetyltransferase complex protein AlgI